MDSLEEVIYYVVQIGEHYYKHTDDIATTTKDEEQAYAFTNLANAKQKAIEMEGVVRKREVSYKELQELSEQHEEEYTRLPVEEREIIETFCQNLLDITDE
ncbi:hypothetical protein ACFVR1_09795 [Psychrobacillus sp. NPDC058041]|uniref:hypothetical protein n=1 Tax=Psychrobacillus sp. NPDC058041 TaxID=3346310 RepID=UPI0036DC6981